MTPKAETLLQHFTDAERRRLGAAVKSHKRKSLRGLFRYLLKVAADGSAFSKDAAFRAAFGRGFTPDEDYLLRNELRLAVGVLHTFLTDEELQRERDINPNLDDTMLMSALLRHHCFDELERLFPRALAAALERLNFEQARRQCDIYFQYLIFHRAIAPDTLREAHALMTEQLRILKILYRTGTLLNMNNRSTCELMLAMANSPVDATVESTLDLDFSAADSPFIRYIEAMFASQREPDFARRIALVRSAAESISLVQGVYPVEKQLALATLATLYYIQRDYIRACEVFEETLDYARAAALPETVNLVEILHNYVTTLMRLGRYADALAVMDERRVFIARHDKLALRFDGFRCFCHIFLRHPAEAFAALPRSSTHHAEFEHLYFRFIYAVIPYLNGDAETAHRESVNLVDYFSRHRQTSLYFNQKFAADALRKFYAALLGAPDDTQKKLCRLAEELDRHSAEHHGETDTFFLSWLRKEIAAKLR